MPALLVPASWLFFGSNLIWCIAEYHKQKINQKSSHTDTAYMQYAMISTVMTLVPAIGATVSLFFPPAALVTFIISTTLGISLGSLSLYCWLDYTLGREYNAKSESYQQLTESLEIEPLAAPLLQILSHSKKIMIPYGKRKINRLLLRKDVLSFL